MGDPVSWGLNMNQWTRWWLNPRSGNTTLLQVDDLHQGTRSYVHFRGGNCDTIFFWDPVFRQDQLLGHLPPSVETEYAYT